MVTANIARNLVLYQVIATSTRKEQAGAELNDLLESQSRLSLETEVYKTLGLLLVLYKIQSHGWSCSRSSFGK